MGNGLSSDQGSFTPHGLRDVDGTGAEQRQHDWSNPEDDNMLAGAPNNEELNSLSTFNTRHTPNVQSKTCDLHIGAQCGAGVVTRSEEDEHPNSTEDNVRVGDNVRFVSDDCDLHIGAQRGAGSSLFESTPSSLSRPLSSNSTDGFTHLRTKEDTQDDGTPPNSPENSSPDSTPAKPKKST